MDVKCESFGCEWRNIFVIFWEDLYALYSMYGIKLKTYSLTNSYTNIRSDNCIRCELLTDNQYKIKLILAFRVILKYTS